MRSVDAKWLHSLKKMHQLADTLKMGLAEDSVDNKRGSTGGGGGEAASLASGRIPYRELVSLYAEATDRLRSVSNEKDELTMLAQQRQEAFLRTEEKYKDDMRALEVRLQKMGQEDRGRMDPLRDMHGNIQDTINSIQNKTARVLQDQERDLIRAFRARLADVTVELENERKKNESGSAEWVARCRKLTEELEWLRDLTDKLTSENKSVLKDNRRFKRQMKTQEEDRSFLITQLVSVKKENARLRYSFDQLMSGNVQPIGLAPGDGQSQGLLPPGTGNVSSITGLPMSASKHALRAGTPVTDAYGNRSGASTPFGGARSQAPSRPQSAMLPNSFPRAATPNGRPGTAAGYPSVPGAPSPEFAEKEQRYKALVNKLQRQVEDGARSYRQLRTSYTQELAGRTELQAFVKKCIDDVRQDMAERGRSATLRRAQGAHRATSAGALRSKQALPPPLDPRTIPLSEFTPHDRISVMQWLLSQDQVIFMLYEKIFPQRGNGATGNEDQGILNADFAQSMSQTQPLPSGAPGSLFTATSASTSSLQPPSSQSANSQFRPTSAMTSSSQQRPQTTGGSRPSSSTSSTSSSLQHTAYGANSKPSQYERPLGTRPLSGYDHSAADNDAVAEHKQQSSHQQRPHTSAGVSTLSTSFDNGALQAEVEAELRAARSHRSATVEDEDDEQDELDEEDEDDHERRRFEED